jgi:hypothetical protein
MRSVAGKRRLVGFPVLQGHVQIRAGREAGGVPPGGGGVVGNCGEGAAHPLGADADRIGDLRTHPIEGLIRNNNTKAGSGTKNWKAVGDTKD